MALEPPHISQEHAPGVSEPNQRSTGMMQHDSSANSFQQRMSLGATGATEEDAQALQHGHDYPEEITLSESNDYSNYLSLPMSYTSVPDSYVLSKLFAEGNIEVDDTVYCMNYPVPDGLVVSCDELVIACTAYKRVDRKIKPIPGVFPQEASVTRQIPDDPLLTLPPLSPHPPIFVPTKKVTSERMEDINVNKLGFLWPKEEKLFQHILLLNEQTLAFEDTDRGTLKESYFSPYIIPTEPHIPWAYKNIPIPPGIRQQVMDVLKLKIKAGVYEASQSSYRSKWFCVVKKNGKLRIVHDLQPLNQVTIRDAGQPPNLDNFVKPFSGSQCYTVFDLFWGFDARKMHTSSRDMTAFLTPIGLLRLTSLPTGFTNSPAEFQKCMTFILNDEIPHIANIFIDDLPIKGPPTIYPDKAGNPEVLEENPGIRRFIWEHAQDVHRIMHRIKEAGATFSASKIQLCLPEALILGQRCTPEGRLPDDDKVEKILNWPDLTTPKEARAFMGLCGTVRIWIAKFSQFASAITELWRKGFDFEWNARRKAAFETLKKAVASAPALQSIDYESDQPVIFSVDSSYMGTGFILSQLDEKGVRRPARYGSLPFTEVVSRYSQPKLELYGLFRALRHFRLYLIGVKKLQVEVDAKYIKGMLNEPDLQPSNAMNRWVQGILMFDFELKHVPASKFRGPDALSRRPLGPGEIVEEYDDSWLDNIALYLGTPTLQYHERALKRLPWSYNPYDLPLAFIGTSDQEQHLREIQQFLETLEIPSQLSAKDRKRLFRQST
jgi:hypothetical protein